MITAASISDGLDKGYFQYIAYLNQPVGGYADIYEGRNGGIPWPWAESGWTTTSSSANLNQVTAPLRIVSLNHHQSVLNEWEWFAALSRLRRPVEFVVIEDGTHVLEMPWDRLISQGGNVDWFDFWLNGHEDPSPDKAPQYLRWRQLRQQPAEARPSLPRGKR